MKTNLPLACQYQLQHESTPVLFIHGFLGSGQDWQQVIAHLAPEQNWITIDLPGHGDSQNVTLSAPQAFQQCCQLIQQCLQALAVTRCHLVGYSLGGRIALHYLQMYPSQVCQLIVESAHTGLIQENEKAARISHDKNWAQRFTTEPLNQVLLDWYLQAVFADLSEQQRQKLCQLRSHNNGKALGKMLLATSLGKQENLCHVISEAICPVSYFVAEQDLKFTQLANILKKTTPQLNKVFFTEAGHNIHFAKPIEYANQISRLILDKLP
ncbi:2-succinyl-6-hydroxy-2,4-cyclohexadiene-1-carboxylate synthase [Motilimonas sp. 1_MG-2023]|uniref:2-succinyl-6-hydroxy-2, 4-cyclohexadiene-1-carboxylate synthase n=1 Tax=Motilimonas sp. 1_MG-2023 TaxID=3062672 RepID=UPI0026E2BC44|nr:2-succinyl-6-hydroxy-2,4-cyclohexadiene-1-carboxylate synthase [Motilimonas sp. 1_MG-2023]MDO6527570.1 2-succinyl-6-hydroxy-2,4-cyclohexadiene-1-carboxylate synthase [Motilimonas sp. 1_MG-2023]